MEQMLAENITTVWLIFGTICIALEAMAIPGIGFLFAGLASVTIGALLTFGALDTESVMQQFALFFVFIFIWAAALWIPLKKFHKKQMTNNFNNIVGDIAVVESKVLIKNKTGKVKWSGTTMRAKLSANDPAESINKGEEAIIESISGNLLTITTEHKKES